MADRHDLRTNAFLTGFYVKHVNPGMVADIVAPRVLVQHDNDKFPIWDDSHMRYINTLRTDKAESAEYKRGYTEGTYYCEMHALHDFIGRKELSNADSPVSPLFDRVTDMGGVLDLAREVRVATLAATSGSIATANKITLDAGEEWTNYTSSDSLPLNNIADAKGRIFAAVRMIPNAIIIPYATSLKLAQHPQLIDRCKGIDPTLLTSGGLPPKISGLWVIEAGAGYVTSKKGQTVTIGDVWSADVVYVAYIDGLPAVNDLAVGGGPGRLLARGIPKSTMNRISWMRTFDCGGRIVNQWTEPKRNFATAVEPQEQGIDEQVISTGCAASISNVVA